MTGDDRNTADGTADAQVADGRYTAVLDRFEQRETGDGGSRDADSDSNTDSKDSKGTELAVLLIESGDEVVAERAIPTWRLPEDARRQDAVLDLTLKNGYVVSMTHDPAETERRTSEAQSRFDRLAERPGDEPDEAEEDGAEEAEAGEGESREGESREDES